ncbi:MAG: putative NEK protein kinase [Streblomastix strix]|uniref:Putative NEK protein kinase n=1 Tax=Streblomastix strix TaxID=222440 RepID=A0A5J4VRF1_9EUKA|nr:MAG: putative NEK protein kinase [Streblomastix strix]
MISSESQQLQSVREIENHKNSEFKFIVKFIDHFLCDKKYLYLVLEYYEGGDLTEVIADLRERKESVDEDYAWQILSQLVFTVNFLHFNRVLYKDMKPENIFLTKNRKEIRLGDFGISKVLDSEKSFTKTMSMTPEYASPELLIYGCFRFASDVWGVGMSIYELLTLHRPFWSTNKDETYMNIIADEVKAPLITSKKYSEMLKDVIMAMLEKDYEKRIPMNQIVKVDEISRRIKKYAQDMIGTASGKVKNYLEHLLLDIDTQPAALAPSISLISNSKDADSSLAAQALLPIGAPGQFLTKLIQLQRKNNYTIPIMPEIVAGSGPVQISIRFEDLLHQDRAYRWIGIMDAEHEVEEEYYPASVGYCGQDGNIVHLTGESDKKYISGNETYDNDVTIIMEVNMAVEREKRTLHFFVGGRQQPVSLSNLPDKIKFIVVRFNQGTSVSILSMAKIPNPTVRAIPGEQIIQW